MKFRLSDYISLFVISGLMILVDQVTKTLVRLNLPLGQVYRPDLALSQYARIIHLRNYGAAGGILPSLSIVFTILPFFISLGILYYYPRVARQDRLMRLAMALMLGGAIGNVIDRLTQGGYVTDFISVGNFPVLNIADASISIGAALLCLALLLEDRRKARSSPETDNPASHKETPG